MAATIYIDLDDLPGRLSEIRDVMKPGDRVLVTRDGQPIFHLLPTSREGVTLTSAGAVTSPPANPPPARRTLGSHLGHTKLSADFNEPCGPDGVPVSAGS